MTEVCFHILDECHQELRYSYMFLEFYVLCFDNLRKYGRRVCFQQMLVFFYQR
jgi:hypothetical protein